MAVGVSEPSRSRSAEPQTRSAEPQTRRAELAANLATVEARIEAALRASERRRSDLTLIAVTKTFPASDVRLLAELGIRDVGENRDQEAAAKVADVVALTAEASSEAAASSPVSGSLRWHFIGALQTNKCRSVARYADVVHSVDRVPLVRALDAAAERAGRRLRCLVQVDLDEVARPGRSGARPDDVAAVAAALEAAQALDLGGVMAIAPLGGDPEPAFRRLAELAGSVRDRYPQACIVSAGMSADLEAAVRNGATHLRVGAALLGSRRHAG